MQMWIQIETAAGVRLGDGPILTATQWEHKRQLRAAGTFSFQMPAGDARASLVQVGRVARCFVAAGRKIRERGAGIIAQIGTRVDASGAVLLDVTGDDLLRELVNRRVGNLQLFDTVTSHPSSTFQHGATEAFLNKAVDLSVGDTTSYASLQPNSSTNNWMISDALPFRAIQIVMGPNKNWSTTALKIQYYDASEVAWKDLTVTDGTKVGGASLAQSGVIAWSSAPEHWGPLPGAAIFDVRLWIDGMPAIDVCDVAIVRDQPTADALAKTMAVLAGTWTLDTVLGYDSIARATELGANMIAGGFETTSSGSPGDGVSDTFPYWVNVGVNDGAGNKIEQLSGGAAGTYCLCIRHATSGAESAPEIYTEVDGVPEASDMVLTLWVRGDGAAQGRVRVEDRSHVVANHPQYLTPRVYTGVTAATWTQIKVEFTTPPGCTLVRVRLYGADEGLALGSVYFDGVELRPRLGGDVYYQCANESVLEALNVIAEQTGENWLLSPNGRQIVWLRKDQRDANIACVGGGALEHLYDTAVALIVALHEEQNGYELASRVYATGGGSGAERVTMAEATRSIPQGYTFSRSENYLKRNGAETTLGRIDALVEFPEVVLQGVSPDHRRYGANAVFDRAYVWLLAHSATDTDRITGNVPRGYSLTLTGCGQRILPGYQVRLVYRRVENRVLALDVNALLWVLAATERVDASGAETVALEVATAATRPGTSDADRLVRLMRDGRAMRARG